ncbi:MAG: Mov34/MPN/PAD-1 family protein, partial [Polyangiaceae bacterium]|nr:Mov34/MPN/PAD-1 family protein [Polyangiaceae bacterium]
MARDLNRLFEDVRNSRPVFVTQDGDVQPAPEAEQSAEHEAATTGAPKPRTQLKPEVFGCLGCDDAPKDPRDSQTWREEDVRRGGRADDIAPNPERHRSQGDPACREGVRLAQPPPGNTARNVVHMPLGVIEAMHADATRHEGETGGILVGPDLGHVTELILSGHAAERTPHSYRLDPAHLQPLLDRAERRGLRFVGVWHVHPEGVAELSSTDVRAARRILSDPDWGVSSLLLALSVRVGDGFETKCFGMASATASPVLLPVVLTASPANARVRHHADPDPGDRAFDGARVRTDLCSLEEAGFRAELRRRRKRGYVIMAERNGVELVFALPPEYPLSPPEVLVSAGEELRALAPTALPEVLGWSSERSLLALAEEAEAAARAREPAKPRKLPWTIRLFGPRESKPKN